MEKLSLGACDGDCDKYPSYLERYVSHSTKIMRILFTCSNSLVFLAPVIQCSLYLLFTFTTAFIGSMIDVSFFNPMGLKAFSIFMHILEVFLLHES